MVNFKVTEQQQKDHEAVFILEPLEAGFGHTLGNVLRRVLLTTLEGAAVTSVKIEGISHQFSVIPHVSEDVVEIILNLKDIRLKLYSDKPVKLSLKATGKKEVKAKDIDTMGMGEVVNPNLHIAYLNDAKAKFSLEMTAEKGRGYILADESKVSEIGVMPVDAIYSPVRFVSYEVEPARVGGKINFDKLILRLATDDTITPSEALYQAAKILSQYFKQIYEPEVAEEEEKAVKADLSDGLAKMSVEELDLPVRLVNALKGAEIETVSQLISTPRVELLKAKNLGSKSLELILDKLKERGLSLSET